MQYAAAAPPSAGKQQVLERRSQGVPHFSTTYGVLLPESLAPLDVPDEVPDDELDDPLEEPVPPSSPPELEEPPLELLPVSSPRTGFDLLLHEGRADTKPATAIERGQKRQARPVTEETFTP
jgi:hypothetical protein